MSLPLQGVRILELSQAIAGPFAARTLGDLGAEIIKVEQPGVGDMSRRMGPHFLGGESAYYLNFNRNKRGITLDLRKPEGRQVFYRLVGVSDVVFDAFRPTVLPRMGLDYDSLKKANPTIISCSLSAFGQEGPWATRPGFDQNAQAATGMQTRNGGRDGTPAPPPYTFNDYGTGLMAAYGVMLALLERERTGRGQRIETALSYTASTFSSPYLMDYQGCQRTEIEGPMARPPTAGSSYRRRAPATGRGLPR